MGKKQEGNGELFGKFMSKVCQSNARKQENLKRKLKNIGAICIMIKFAFYVQQVACCLHAWLSYQMPSQSAYPAEFMAANLTRNKDDIKKVTKLMDECKLCGWT